MESLSALSALTTLGTAGMIGASAGTVIVHPVPRHAATKSQVFKFIFTDTEFLSLLA